MTDMNTGFAIVAGWILLGFVGLLGVWILWRIYSGNIKLDDILNDPVNGKASLSRLQFLIFTVVIALSLFYVIVQKDVLPEIPTGFYVLLGISGATYAVTRGVDGQVQNEKERTEQEQAKAAQLREQAEIARASRTP